MWSCSKAAVGRCKNEGVRVLVDLFLEVLSVRFTEERRKQQAPSRVGLVGPKWVGESLPATLCSSTTSSGLHWPFVNMS